MAEEPEGPKQQILFKKIKPPGPTPHGGAWKVAYADFVTAMMAFFLLLWLLSSASQEQLQGISNYFNPIGTRVGSMGSEGVFGGISASDPGPVPAPLISPQPAPTAKETIGDKEIDKTFEAQPLSEDLPNITDIKAENEAKQFKAAEAAIQQALDEVPELRELHEAVKIDITDEGLVIQLIDQVGKSMFKPGGAELNDHTKNLLLLIASVVERLPNKISLSGHTDSTPFRSSLGKTNWDLSLDRANAGRRELRKNGLSPKRFLKVVGRADRDLLFPDNPTSPGNRRLIITLLRDPRDQGVKFPEPPRIFGVDQ
jgi:chemotaxis protein MotB